MTTTTTNINTNTNAFEAGYPYQVDDSPDNNVQRKDVIASLQRTLVAEHDWTAADAVLHSEDSEVYCIAPEGLYAINFGGGDYWFVEHCRIVDDEDTGSLIFDPGSREELSEFLNKL